MSCPKPEEPGDWNEMKDIIYQKDCLLSHLSINLWQDALCCWSEKKIPKKLICL